MINFKNIPVNPGCYIYKNDKGKIIYIGKAKNLKKRVSNYFQKQDHDLKTTQLVKNIKEIDYIITDSEVEALVLENTLIKKHRPKYNIDLKDSKRYAYLKITDEKFPRLIIARTKTKKGKLFGPFTSGADRHYVMQSLIKTFQLRTCKRFPKKPCIRYQIKLCEAPCKKIISEEYYNEKLKFIENILKGNTKDIIKILTKRMDKFSNDQSYELALEKRNQILAIKNLEEKQNMDRSKVYNEDIINYIIKKEKVYLMLFNIYKGTLENKEEFSFDYNSEFLEEFIVQYYSSNKIPKEIILPDKTSKTLKLFLEKKIQENQRVYTHSKVNLVIPKIGEKKKLLDLVKKNIELNYFGNTNMLNELQTRLRLQEFPEVIECFDISHLSGTSTVGSMVQFRNGKPDKSNYRRFRIRTVSGIDDFGSIAEVVKRRYVRLQTEHRTMPNLIIVDGGKGQLSSALAELDKLNLKIPIIGLAKQFEEIFVPGSSHSIPISKKEKISMFIQNIRDEAHRFAITYNRLLRKKELIKK